MKDLFEVRTAFFRPLWRRVVATVLPFAWAGVEASRGATVWALIFAAAGVYLAWAFFVAFDRGPED
ncbi:hypothetical protein DXV76_01380 [Rhodobacteraceae bacterium CCMM004]|nr:hypothetical protein DXV76_01380 [Rhodobacteraceae bacterium CCMM004]